MNVEEVLVSQKPQMQLMKRLNYMGLGMVLSLRTLLSLKVEAVVEAAAAAVVVVAAVVVGCHRIRRIETS